MPRTVEEIEIDGHKIELITATGLGADPLSQGSWIGWATTFRGERFGSGYDVQEITDESRREMIAEAKAVIEQLKISRR